MAQVGVGLVSVFNITNFLLYLFNTAFLHPGWSRHCESCVKLPCEVDSQECRCEWECAVEKMIIPTLGTMLQPSTGMYEDLMAVGRIDPTQVLRCLLSCQDLPCICCVGSGYSGKEDAPVGSPMSNPGAFAAKFVAIT